MMRASGVASGNFYQKPEFQEYVRGHNPLAVFAKHSILNRITDVIDDLQAKGAPAARAKVFE